MLCTKIVQMRNSCVRLALGFVYVFCEFLLTIGSVCMSVSFFVVCTLFFTVICEFSCLYQCNRLPGKTCIRNDLISVAEWDVELYVVSQSPLKSYAIIIASTFGRRLCYASDLKKPSYAQKPQLYSKERTFLTKYQGCYRYFLKVSPIFDINTGFKSIVDTDIDTLP